jgi:hypothetical protein
MRLLVKYPELLSFQRKKGSRNFKSTFPDVEDETNLKTVGTCTESPLGVKTCVL